LNFSLVVAVGWMSLVVAAALSSLLSSLIQLLYTLYTHHHRRHLSTAVSGLNLQKQKFCADQLQ